MVDVQVLEQTRRQTGLDEGLVDPFGAKRRLVRVFQDDRVAVAASAGTMLFTAVSSG